MLKVGAKRNIDRKRIGKSPLDEAETDLEDTQIAAVMPVNQMAKPSMDGAATHGDQPDIQTDNCQGQSRQSGEVAQHSTFQIEAVFFQIAMHLFGPHPAAIIPQGHFTIRQVGSQAPGFIFAELPVNQQVGGIDFFSSQVSMAQPAAFTSLADETTERFPLVMLVQPDAGICFLPQHVEPVPLIEPFEDF